MIEPRMVWSDDLQRVLANFPIELARIDTNYGGFVKIAVILYFTQCIFGVCSPCVFSPRDPSGVNTA